LRSSSVSVDGRGFPTQRGARPYAYLRASKCDPQTLGGGAHILRVDLWQPPDEWRLGVFGPNHRSIDLCDDAPTHAQTASEGNRVRTSQTPSKCYQVQTLLVISVTLVLVTSCCTSSFPISHKQPTTSRFPPGLYLLLLPFKGRGGCPNPQNCRYSLDCREDGSSQKLGVVLPLK
jgi:hypothetical protein